jgi:UDP-N-acetylglucosamine transferase subunit ALG13
MGELAQLDVRTANERMIGAFFAEIDTRAALPGLRAIVQSWRPDLIIRESWEFASTLVAEQHGIPIAQVGLGVAEVEEQTVQLAAPALDRLRTELGLAPDPDGRALRETAYFTTLPAALDDPAVDPPASTLRFRHHRPSDAAPLPDWWPGNDGPLVYVTFGSVAGAKHLPYFPALYRQALDALAELPVRVLVTTGDSGDPAALEPLPANAHAERWVPQDAVLRDAAAIVCHGGYGTTLGALAHGVPLVVVPLFSIDQWANAAAIARARAGAAVGVADPGRRVLDMPSDAALAGLTAAVRCLLDDPAPRREATRIAAAMRALEPVEAAVEPLLEVAATAAVAAR